MTTVSTRTGEVRGKLRDGVHAFRGIPYAQPPIGPLRFTAPLPHEPWEGVVDATEFGSAPPQPMRLTTSDEWLTVNVWTPDPGASGLPVMVWLYGGRFTTGAADESYSDGSRLAAGGVVVVSLNYRVAGEGFMLIDGAVPNRGLLDQVAALRWVRDNIAGFGGDPDTVTVFGESAGAASVAMLMVMPSAAGLFRRGIAESVPNFLFGSDLAADVAAAVADKLGVRATASELAGVSPQALADAAGAIDYRARWGYGLAVRGSHFGPVIDGDILPDSPFRALAAGTGRDIELLIGHNRDEYRIVLGGDEVTPEAAQRALSSLPPIADGADAYRSGYPHADDRELYELVCSDFVYRMPTLHIAQAHAAGGGTTYLYEFCFDASAVGAAHTTEMPMVFDTLDSELGSALYGAAPQAESVAHEMSAAWRAFATNGDPGWPAYEPVVQLTRVFDMQSRTQRYPEQASQLIWADYPFDPFTLDP
ncbi:carboxylesterase type B [Mycobacterium sp. JS623]|uniref:carboxylesterase/lipase family protein n=1 Tax=Mycobacterium sp. JS623 TaxID=212767 RepID=UPI0002A57083|nr:carboxylesterase family protein [Mycobacterium sp. JS623]AGB21937.1 carboxylesterase type B [Mycobacterium sp. JS623]